MSKALGGPVAQLPAEESAEDSAEAPRRWWALARNSLRAPGALVRLALYDPAHIPERLTIYSVDKQADSARAWAEKAREAEPGAPVAVLADTQRRRTVSTARIDGAVAGTPFFIALVPAYIAFLRQEVRFHLRVAALYGEDPSDPRIAADFLVLRRVHKDTERALSELALVRANPVPPHRERDPAQVVVRGRRQHPDPRGFHAGSRGGWSEEPAAAASRCCGQCASWWPRRSGS